ncbi:DegT/DnrJ/EryC1/StrS family aminotransferase [Rapidithrix thailandica]|uniref:DegT/DnrJ/EryC1/StrS family aminotransferase n=1 Tax=Rapidithrix thailandica TaxID=413964 RepID=A0AAW9SBR8_9BACT
MPGTELFGPEEKKEVMDVLESGILFRYNHDDLRNGHWKAKEFEQELAKFNKVKYAHAVSSGSTAVSTALAAVGVGAGDEVIVPPFTYIATVEAVLMAGALPVFAEIDETLCLSPEGIKAAITPKTKAVALVHMCGAMAKLDEIIEVCNEHNIILVEDTAQALGGSFKGNALGSYGKVGCFSFDFFKIITAGEGGAIITNDEQVYNNAHAYADHGHDHIGDNRGAEQHPILGFNFRISELHAAVGLAQVRKIEQILVKQKANKKAIKDSLAKFDEITFRHLPDEDGDSATFLSFFLPTEDKARKVAAALGKAGLGGAYWYDNNFHYIKNWEHLKEMKTCAKLPIEVLGTPQDYAKIEFPKSDDIVSRLISLQVRVTWTEEELKQYCEKLETVLKETL